MVATLSGQTQFEIAPDEQTGSFLESPRIDWTWSVTALEPGDDLQMELRITPLIETTVGREAGTPVGPYVARIDVEAQPRSTWSQATAGLASVVDHPLFRGFIPVVTITGLLAGFWRKALNRPWPWAAGGTGAAVGGGEASDHDAGQSSHDAVE